MRESELLSHIFESIPKARKPVIVGPGDDLAQLEIAGSDILIGVDQVIAGQHVDVTKVAPELVGRKAVCRCLSDVAAMGAVPVAAVATVAIPAQDPIIDGPWVQQLSDAMHATGQSYACPIVGGDVALVPSHNQSLVITVTIIATSKDGRVLLRSHAKVGDGVFVTGTLGRTLDPDGHGHHLHFVPRIEVAQKLKLTLGTDLHAMIDISDGLARDAGHVAAASKVGIEVDGQMIPRRKGASLDQALGDGEDYELCFTACSEVSEIDGLPVARVGRVVEAARQGPCRVVLLDGARSRCVDKLGFEHSSEVTDAS